jgi:hypothetical protein
MFGKGGLWFAASVAGPSCVITLQILYHSPDGLCQPRGPKDYGIFGLSRPIWGSKRIDHTSPSSASRPK